MVKYVTQPLVWPRGKGLTSAWPPDRTRSSANRLLQPAYLCVLFAERRERKGEKNRVKERINEKMRERNEETKRKKVLLWIMGFKILLFFFSLKRCRSIHIPDENELFHFFFSIDERLLKTATKSSLPRGTEQVLVPSLAETLMK